MTFQRTGPGAQAPAGGSSSASKLVIRKRHGRSAWRFLAVVVVAALAFLVSIPYWSGTPAAPVVSSPLPTPPPVVIKETEIVTVEVERVIEVPVERIIPVETKPITPVVEPRAATLVVPVLSLPAEGSTSRNPVRFEWMGQLRPGQTYRVTAYQIGGDGGEQSPYLTDTGWEVTFDGDTYGGWRWVVAILEGERVMAISEVGQFWFDPFADSVGGGE